jgi:flagellar biosynthetic protein FliQ
MDSQQAVELGQHAMLTALTLCAPLLLVGLGVGLFSGLLQTVTQIHDPSLSLIPKILGVGAAVLICLPWLVDRLLIYTHDLWSQAPSMLGGG